MYPRNLRVGPKIGNGHANKKGIPKSYITARGNSSS